MLAMALANPPATPGPGTHYAQQSYTPHFGNYGNITTSLPMTHDTSYANREAFPASQFHRLGSGQESGHSSPCTPGPIVAANQTLYENNTNDSYNY